MTDEVAVDARTGLAAWNDTALDVATRVEALVSAMTLREKIHQLFGVWVGAATDGQEVAPFQNDSIEEPVDLDAVLPHGLGQLTRPFGTAPVDPALGALSLTRTQRRIVEANRFGIPAIAHEECLAGFATWQATCYPVPLSWGATFDPELVERMSATIGRDLRRLGVHQGLAPVLDVVRDGRWGRVEETIGEDPYLVGTVGTAYVRGLQSAGIIATLKHFAGYSASRAGRNLAPVPMGARERADVILPPFEMAVREGRPGSVMNAYTDTDGVPSAADERLLTGLLRDTWGFAGTVVADYFAIDFLRSQHGIAATLGEAAAAALNAGIDIELPTVKTFGQPLLDAVGSGLVPESDVDAALRRVLRQKVELGLLDPDWSPVPEVLTGVETDDADALRGSVDLDPAGNRALAREVAENAVVLLRNDGALPLPARPGRIALIGPNADLPHAVLGCYSFPVHVGVLHEGTPDGVALPTLREALAAEFPGSDIVTVLGTSVDGGEREDIAEAVRAAAEADLVVLALGDRAGLFGRGTSGEGCDAESLELPGAQQELLDAMLDAGPPVIVSLLAGRPYALGRAVDRAAGIVQSFFPGEEGTAAIAGVLSGRVNPSGRLPVSVPARPGVQPSTYLAARLGQVTPAYGFGHGLSYTSFEWGELTVTTGKADTEGGFEVGLTVRNTGDRAGTEVVQLYLHDPVASVVQPVQRLIGYHRFRLAAGDAARLSVSVPADLVSFTGRDGRRIVEPGELELRFCASSTDVRLTAEVELTGAVRTLDHTRHLHPTFVVESVSR